MTDRYCKRCHNTGLKLGHPCGCIYGEMLLEVRRKEERERRAETLARELVKKEVISTIAWQHGKDEIIKAVQKALDESGIWC